jgi:hypothetical protein
MRFIRSGAAAAAAFLAACSSAGAPSSAQIQLDAQTALALLKTAGCAIDVAATAAAPIIAVTVDAKGQQVLQASDASGKALCAVPVAAPAPNAAPSGS